MLSPGFPLGDPTAHAVAASVPTPPPGDLLRAGRPVVPQPLGRNCCSRLLRGHRRPLHRAHGPRCAGGPLAPVWPSRGTGADQPWLPAGQEPAHAAGLLGISSSLYEQWSRSEEHTSELQSRPHLVCRLLLEKKKKK